MMASHRGDKAKVEIDLRIGSTPRLNFHLRNVLLAVTLHIDTTAAVVTRK